jgi:hypothetical protein
MVIGINIKQLATFDIMFRMEDSSRKSKHANFFNLYFKSSKIWVNEIGIKINIEKDNFPTIIDYNGNLIPIRKNFRKPICNEDVVDTLLENIFQLNTKYQIISQKKINSKDFTLQEKISLLEFAYNNFKKSKIMFDDKEKRKISTFVITSIPTSYKFSDFKIKEYSLYYMQSLLMTEQYLDSKEKKKVDIMFDCYKMISYSNLQLTNNSMIELREYFSKNIHKFISLESAITIRKLSEVIDHNKNKYDISTIHREDMRYIIKEFNKTFKGITF